jgi:hypothetical protein
MKNTKTIQEQEQDVRSFFSRITTLQKRINTLEKYDRNKLLYECWYIQEKLNIQIHKRILSAVVKL